MVNKTTFLLVRASTLRRVMFQVVRKSPTEERQPHLSSIERRWD